MGRCDIPHNEYEHPPITTGEMQEMEAIFLRLSRHDFLRQVAPPPFGEGKPSPRQISQIIERLCVSEEYWRERAFAAWTLGRIELSAEEKQTAAHTLCRLITNQLKTKDRLGALSFHALLLSVSLVPVLTLLSFLFYYVLFKPGIDGEELSF